MSVADDAATLVGMNVADLVGHIEATDLDTLKAALALEQKGQNRKGAIAALEAAIDGHPEQAADAAAQAGAVLADAPADPNAVSVAPPRAPQSLLDQLDLRWGELKHFVRGLEGEAEGEIGEVLDFVRSKL